LADLHEKLAPFYSDIGRPSIDPDLMIRMLIVGYYSPAIPWIDRGLVRTGERDTDELRARSTM
jgi:hypothetical protein